ncbi:MAG: isochorismatase family protein [Pseudomonadota bacterium]
MVAIIDLQDRLVPALADGASLVERAASLAAGARMLGVPIIATEQVPDKLGRTVAPLQPLIDNVCHKTRFSAVDTLLQHPAMGDRDTVILAGCEAHVCVLQTALGLLSSGRRVFLAADAAGSRKPNDAALANDRLVASGAVIGSVEMLLFELLEDASHPSFRSISNLIK